MDTPLPTPTAETLPFWQGCAQQELRYQYCPRCQRAQFPPRSACISCQGLVEWRTSQKTGVVHSVTVVHRAPTKAFQHQAPYALALIDVAEGFRMMMNVQTAQPEKINIGDPVAIVFEQKSETIWLPQAIVQSK